MTLKSITLHRPATDNVGNFCDSGTDLVVGDAQEAGVIDADRAQDILNGHGAVGHHTKAADKPSARRAPKSRKAKSSPKQQAARLVDPPAPVVQTDTVEVGAKPIIEA